MIAIVITIIMEVVVVIIMTMILWSSNGIYHNNIIIVATEAVRIVTGIMVIVPIVVLSPIGRTRYRPQNAIILKKLP